MNSELIENNTNSSGEGNKNLFRIFPWILSAIFAVLAIVFIALFAKEKNRKDECECEKEIGKVDPEHFIPIKESIYDDPNQGANGLVGKYDILDTIYFPKLDIYNMESTNTRTILTHFKTYQQTSEISCGCCSLLMSLTYLGETNITEKECFTKTGTNENGVTTTALTNLLIEKGYDFEILADFNDTDSSPMASEQAFADYIKESLSEKEPIIILSADWGGHYLVIIGIDEIGKGTGNYVVIVADPYDSTDHIQDGYNIWGLERLYATMLMNIEFIENEDERSMQFIRVKRKE